MLRNNADVKAVIYMIITTTLFVVLWTKGMELSIWLQVPLYISFLFFSVAVAVMAHNHNHLSMWKGKFMNVFTDFWLTVFYGFPVFAWIPTHNTNHHTHVNKEPDYTKTYRYTEKNNLLMLLSYPAVSSYFQQTVIGKFLVETYSRNKGKFWLYTTQIIFLISWIAFFLILDWRKALLFVVVPQQFSLFSILVFNYVQHVHADEETKYNHSRNFMGVLNSMLFNNGLHTVHHLYPSVHWSDLPAEHAKIKHLIDESLIEENGFWPYIIRNYFLGIFSAKYRTNSMRLARIETGASAKE